MKTTREIRSTNFRKSKPWSDSRANPKCNRCGSTDVYWVDTEWGWRLQNNDRERTKHFWTCKGVKENDYKKSK